MTIIGAGVLVLAIGAYLYGAGMAECIKVILLDIRHRTEVKAAKKTHSMEQLIDFIEFHSRAKQLS